VAQEDKLLRIHKALRGDSSCQAVVLQRLGRIRKTQLSIAYAKQHKDDYLAIFWLNIKDKDSVKQSFAKLAKQISREHLPAILVNNQKTNQNLDKVVKSVKAWLSLLNNTQ
jgi:DNA-binding FrmR family transcriptional regulator